MAREDGEDENQVPAVICFCFFFSSLCCMNYGLLLFYQLCCIMGLDGVCLPKKLSVLNALYWINT